MVLHTTPCKLPISVIIESDYSTGAADIAPHSDPQHARPHVASSDYVDAPHYDLSHSAR